MSFRAVLSLGGLVILGLATLYWVGRCVYLFFLHPLAKYPGPPLAAITDAWYVWSWMNGRFPFIMRDQHERYGDVVRIAPNELSFTTPQSYIDIYGHAIKGKKRYLKSSFYDTNKPLPGVFNVRDPIEHTRQRKYLSHGFSSKSLREQEPIVHNYVDAFLKQIKKLGSPDGVGVDITEAFNWLTFDIIGDLAFGESFEAVSRAHTHPWISLIFDAGRWSLLVDIQRRLPLIRLALPFLLPKDIIRRSKQHRLLTEQKTKKRIAVGNDTKKGDFFAYMLSKGGMSEAELSTQASTLIIAGSETTSTALAGIVYFLLSNPARLCKLQHEVRKRFSNLDDITGDATSQLPYLFGVIEEGLRLFSPVPAGLPRVCPGATIDKQYIPPGVIVSTSSWSMSHDPRYWYQAGSFLPERWIDDGYGDMKQASQPFSTGPRSCLGVNLAYLEMRIILAKMVFVYDWEAKSELNWWENLEFNVLWKKPELRVVFRSCSRPDLI